MATARAANIVEQAVGHDGSTVTQQDIANYHDAGDQSQPMKALVWQGKGKVEIGKLKAWAASDSVYMIYDAENRCSRCPQAQNHRAERRHPEGDRKYHLWQRLAPPPW